LHSEADAAFDLSQVVVINESSAEEVPGDVSVFRSEREACRHLEPWWVEDSEGFALSGSGDRIVLGCLSNTVCVERREPHPTGDALVLSWLQAAARAIQAARRSDEVLPDNISGLINHVGFSR
jgi:hypothetical protein